MWREKRNLYLEFNLKCNGGVKVDKLIKELLNNGIPLKSNEFNELSNFNEINELNELNELSNFNVILPYPSYSDINDYILENYFSYHTKILVI